MDYNTTFNNCYFYQRGYIWPEFQYTKNNKICHLHFTTETLQSSFYNNFHSDICMVFAWYGNLTNKSDTLNFMTH